MHALSSADFRRFQQLVHREVGIFLSEQKRALLAGRVGPRLRALALDSYAAYYERVTSDRDELTQMIDAVCTNETCFFREPRQFAFLEGQVLPWWRQAAEASQRPRTVKAWSAACSTGEEPFSLAMSLLHHLPEWTVQVVASDISTKALRRASAARWPIARAEEVPEHYRKRFLLRGTGSAEGQMAASRELASRVRFAQVNLHHESYPLPGKFDLVFCRNVLIYFDAESKRRVIERLLARLAPGGILFLGHSESLTGWDNVRAVGPTAYALR
jgi:chemotaxis protein methyltransferase CheR